jgi:hypothetical protein
LFKIGFAEYEGERDEYNRANEEVHECSEEYADVLSHTSIRRGLDGEQDSAENHDQGYLLHDVGLPRQDYQP